MATLSSAIRCFFFQIRFFICHCFSITQGYIIIIICYLVLYHLVLNWNAVTKIFTSSNSLLEKLMCSWNLISFKEQHFLHSFDSPTFNHGWFYGYLRIIYHSSHWINYQWISPFFYFYSFIYHFIYLSFFVCFPSSTVSTSSAQHNPWKREARARGCGRNCAFTLIEPLCCKLPFLDIWAHFINID